MRHPISPAAAPRPHRSPVLRAARRTLLALAATVLLSAAHAAEDAGREKAFKALKVDLRRGVVAGSPEVVDKAGAELARLGGAAAVKELLGLLEKVPPGQDSIYWAVLGGIGRFSDLHATEEIARYLQRVKGKPLARDLANALQRSPSPFIARCMRSLVLEGPDDLRLPLARKVARIRAPESVDLLIDLLRVEEKKQAQETPPIAWVAVEGLTYITKQGYGPSAVNWEGWWASNRSKPLPDASDDFANASAGTAVDFLKLGPDRARREGFVGVEEAPPRAVVVLSAIYEKKLKRDLNNDHMENVLRALGVPHTVVPREDFMDYDLAEAGAVLINCAQYHEFCICPTCKPSGDKNNRLYKCSDCNKHVTFSAKLGEPEVQKLVAFVKGGGYLFCEDWVLLEVLEKAFAKYVSAGEKLKTATVDVVPVRGMTAHDYLRGIFEPLEVDARALAPPQPPAQAPAQEKSGGSTTVVVWPPGHEEEVEGEPGDAEPIRHHWLIDDESFAIKIQDRGRVVSLLTSQALGKAASGDGVVALSFRPGSGVLPGQRAPRGSPGVVTMVLSHFGKQSSSHNERSLQTLLLNILIEANAARKR